MKTEQLIDFLARDVEPAARPAQAQRLLLTIGAGLASALLLMAAFIGVRPDIGANLGAVLAKAGFAAAAAAFILPLAARLMMPGRPLGWRIGAIGLFVAASALAAIIALWGEAPEKRLDAWLGGGFPWCLALIPVLAAPTAVALAWLMRAFAPTRLALTGAAIGALSGGIGAMAYAMYCPVDSIAFVTTWYTLAIALCAALGAVLVERYLRW